MAMFRTIRRFVSGRQNDIRAYKRFDHLNTTDQARIVYHGDSRAFSEIERAHGLKRYIQNPALSTKPTILEGGGTKNTVTTTTDPCVAATYATRGSMGGKNRYIYAMFIPAGKGIDLTQMPHSKECELGKITFSNARTQEILVLDVPLKHVLGYVSLDLPKKQVDSIGVAQVVEEYVELSDPNTSLISREDLVVFTQFKLADSFPIVPV